MVAKKIRILQEDRAVERKQRKLDNQRWWEWKEEFKIEKKEETDRLETEKLAHYENLDKVRD